MKQKRMTINELWLLKTNKPYQPNLLTDSYIKLMLQEEEL